MPTDAITQPTLPQAPIKPFNASAPSPLAITPPAQPVVSPIQPQQTAQPNVSQPTAPTTSTGLDSGAVALAQAIRRTESNGNFTAQGKSGEYGAYQWEPATWAAQSAAAGVNVPLQDATPAQQNQVAYTQIKKWKDQGYNVGQIASMWNAGEGDPDAYINGNKGTNSSGVSYDTQAYAQKVATAYQQFKTQQPTQNGQTHSTGANTAPQSPSIGGFGENILSSGANFAGNLLNAVAHPITTGQNLLETGAGALQEAGGQTNDNTAKFDQLKDYFVNRYGSPEQLLHTAYTDPVGLASDVSAALGIGGGIVGAIGKVGELAGATDAASTIADVAGGINKASELTNPLTPVIGGVSKLASTASGPISNLVGSSIGISGDSVKALVSGTLPTEDMETLSRASIANDIKSALDEKEDTLSETGAGYDPIRQAGEVPEGYENVNNTPPENAIPVQQNFLEDQLRSVGKVNVEDGNIIPTTVSKVGTGQLSKLQDILDTFKPAFQRVYLTPEEFLTLRTRLSDAAYSDTGIRNTEVARIADGIRDNLNSTYRGAIPGLEDLDATYSAQRAELKTLRKGFLDKDGNLLETATNKIANATKAGKESTLARLEQISPGITQRLQAMKLIEEIQKAKSGAGGGFTSAIMHAGEAGGFIGGAATGNIPVVAASLGTALLASPKLVIPVLQMIGDNKALLQGVVAHLAKYATLGATAQNITKNAETETTNQQTQTTTPQNGQTQPPSMPTNSTSVSSSDLNALANKENFNLSAARTAGYDDATILQFLQAQK